MMTSGDVDGRARPPEQPQPADVGVPTRPGEVVDPSTLRPSGDSIPTEGSGEPREDSTATRTFAGGTGPLTEPQPKVVLSAEVAPTTLGRYQIRRELGRGGFGRVYLAYDESLDREVAIKVPLGLVHPAEIAAFLREAKRLARLRHPGIVSVYDVGVADGRCFIVSDYVAGGSLGEWLLHNKPTPIQSARIVASLADALDHAHASGLVHRDVKPRNVILDDQHRPILLDFGLAISEAEDGHAPGMIVGTPGYMSPEQARGEGHRLDGRTDIYSLGVVLYQMLVGRRPFRAANITELLRQLREDEPQPPRQIVRSVPKELERICLKAMAKSLLDRYTTAGDLAEELLEFVRVASDPQSSREVDPASIETPKVHPTSKVSELAPSTARSSLGSVGDSPSIERRLQEGERRQVTAAHFGCELEDDESSLSSLDPEQEHDLLVEFRRSCRELVVAQGGAVAVSTPRGLLACFGFPTALEDAPRRAIEAARELMSRLEAINAGGRRERGQALACWAAIHSGQAVVGEIESGEGLSMVGDAPNVATRLDGLVEAGQVVITEATRKLVRGFYTCEPLGPRTIRGIPKPLELHRVVARGDAESPIDVARSAGLSPLVGRDQEVKLLEDRWEQAKDDDPQLVLLTGDAGMGKSRLVLVLKEFVADDDPGRSATILEWRCSPQFKDSGLYPAISGLERLLRLRPGDPPSGRFQKLAGHLEFLELAGSSRLELLASLLSIPAEGLYELPALSPQKIREKTLEALLDWLDAQAGRRPVLFIVEDLHWVDPSTLDLLGMMVEQRSSGRILTVLTSRPEFAPPWPAGSGRITLALNRLTRRQIAELVSKKVGVKDLAVEVVDQLAARTDGVPLFIEEFARMFEEQGRLGEGGGGRNVGSPASMAEIPTTLQDLLMSRLDRITKIQEVVQMSATLGREFSYELISSVSTLDEPVLRDELNKLVKAEILYPKGRGSNLGYLFKHALIQDAAYHSLLKARRREFHLRVATVLEARFPETVENQPEVIAEHLTQAESFREALGWWEKAGRRSQGRHSHAEAIVHIQRALEVSSKLEESLERDARELGLQLALSLSLMATKGYAAPEVGPVQARARALCEGIGPDAPLFHVLWGIWAQHFIRSDLDACLELSREIIPLAETLGGPGILMEAYFVPACTLFYRGDYAESKRYGDMGFAHWDLESSRAQVPLLGQNDGVGNLCYSAIPTWYLGHPEQALQRARQALDLAEQLAHPLTTALGLYNVSFVRQLCGLGSETRRDAEAEIALCVEQGFPFWHGMGLVSLGAGLLLEGEAERAIDPLRRGIAMVLATGAEITLAHYWGCLADACRKAGRRDEALEAVDRGFAQMARNSAFFAEAELHRIRGEILLDSGGLDLEVEAMFAKALEVARAQGALSLELRASTSVCRFLTSRGRGSEGKEVLAEVFGRFTEGFETRDLIEARGLLLDA